MSYGDTWQQHHAAGKFDRIKASWAEHTAYIEAARDLVEPLLASQLQALARSVNMQRDRIVVFNPLPWQRDGLVSVPWQGPRPPAVRSVDGTALVPVNADHGVVQ